MAILTKKQMLLKSRSSLSRLIIVVVDQFLPVTLLSDVASCVVYYMGKVYVLLKDAFFPQGTFNWRHAKNEFFRHYFAYYQEEFIDFNKRPDLRGLVTEWMPAEELVKHMKLGDLVEFKGTTSFTLFHVSFFLLSTPLTGHFLALVRLCPSKHRDRGTQAHNQSGPNASFEPHQ